jgi:hypothetical protein
MPENRENWLARPKRPPEGSPGTTASRPGAGPSTTPPKAKRRSKVLLTRPRVGRGTSSRGTSARQPDVQGPVPEAGSLRVEEQRAPGWLLPYGIRQDVIGECSCSIACQGSNLLHDHEAARRNPAETRRRRRCPGMTGPPTRDREPDELRARRRHGHVPDERGPQFSFELFGREVVPP